MRTNPTSLATAPAIPSERTNTPPARPTGLESQGIKSPDRYGAAGEAAFYRECLECIAGDSMRTRGRRLASACLGFWDALSRDVGNRKNLQPTPTPQGGIGSFRPPVVRS